MKALSAYQEKFKSQELELSSNSLSGKWSFLIEKFNNILDYFVDVDRSDVIQKVKSVMAEEPSSDEYSPLKTEGYHSLNLEKAMRIRYSAYDSEGMSNISGYYTSAGLNAGQRSAMIDGFDKGIKFSGE